MVLLGLAVPGFDQGAVEKSETWAFQIWLAQILGRQARASGTKPAEMERREHLAYTPSLIPHQDHQIWINFG